MHLPTEPTLPPYYKYLPHQDVMPPSSLHLSLTTLLPTPSRTNTNTLHQGTIITPPNSHCSRWGYGPPPHPPRPLVKWREIGAISTQGELRPGEPADLPDRDLRTPGSSSHNPAAAPRLVHHRLIARGCATNAPAYQNHNQVLDEQNWRLSCAAKRQPSPSLASTDKPRTLRPGLPRGHSPLNIGISCRPSSEPRYLITSRCQVPRRITRKKVNFTSQVPLRPATAQRALLPQVYHGKFPPTLPSPIQHARDEHGSDVKEFFNLICHIRIHLLVGSTAINFRHGFLVISTVANSTVNISLRGVTRQRPKSPVRTTDNVTMGNSIFCAMQEQNNPDSQAPSRCVDVDGKYSVHSLTAAAVQTFRPIIPLFVCSRSHPTPSIRDPSGLQRSAVAVSQHADPDGPMFLASVL
ncbi:hypothetical protein CNYM01_00330 [Colletotrichum nymphaeae SA-01]|uniref:Uncharacterized protein n=1 Tax=Colletotrichum nymphaeae SA-01 TaxID=1460502 RepID=A0A135RPR8_9PEZI|nr:hypothetical protein CNYM01_00330 [Colletotrichum nymphaeae SA-01]